MQILLLGATLIVAAVIILGLYRVAVGPTVFDRLIATALVTATGVVLIALLGFVYERVTMFVDIALTYALLAFLLPIALGEIFERRRR